MSEGAIPSECCASQSRQKLSGCMRMPALVVCRRPAPQILLYRPIHLCLNVLHAVGPEVHLPVQSIEKFQPRCLKF